MSDAHPDYLKAVDSNGRRLIEIVRSWPDAAVEACPGWTTTRLGEHVGFVWSMVAHLVATNAARFDPPGDEASPPASRDGIPAWLERRLEALLGTLSATDPAKPMWTWTDRSDAGFYHRRMAMETVVHRVDTELAAARAGGTTTSPVDSALAIDGIDELTEVGWRFGLTREVPEPPATSLHLHCTDADGEWLISGKDGRVDVSHQHAKGDAAVRGSASDLFLWLWGRVGDDAVEILGDDSVARSWAALAP